MSTSIWTGDDSSDWADAGNWSPAGVPDASSDAVISIGDAVASASIGTVNSITDTYGLSFESAGTNMVTTFLDNTGSLNVDDSAGAGGTILNVGGTLTNRGSLSIGNTTLSASDEVTAAALDNKGKGSIDLTGYRSNQALLDVTGSAGFGRGGTLTGKVNLAGDSAIEFGSGQIASLAKKAQLLLNGNDAFIEDSADPGSNSALTGLASIRSGATLDLEDSASVSTTGALANEGVIEIDSKDGDGGSSLTMTGALNNSSSLTIGNATLSTSDKVTAAALHNKGSIDLIGSSTKQALLDVTGGAGAGVLNGNIELSGDSAIEFASGQITRLARSAQLQLNGSDAFIEDGSTPGSNSALTGLATIGGGATFDLENGASVSTGALINGGNVDLENKASVSTTGALANDGNVNLDTNGGAGGSSLTLAGALTNSGTLTMGNGSLSTSSKVSATALANTGSINLGGSSKTNIALLDVTEGVAGFGTAGTLTGFVELNFNSAIEFASGPISTLAAGATLFLIGNNAFIEDSSALASNSALAGLSDVEGAININEGASVLTTGGLVDDGSVNLNLGYGDGGSSLTVSGTLANAGSLLMGDPGLSSSDKITASSLDNTGEIGLQGAGANHALLDVTSAASFGTAGTLTGFVQLYQNCAIEFLNGEITTIAKGATLMLGVTGIPNSAFIEDSTALGSNSALTGLSNISGTLDLNNGAALSTTGALTNSGRLSLEGTGSTLSIDGALTNNGAFSIANDTETLAGAVDGVGSFSLSNAHLQFDSSVSAGQTINESGADALVLEEAQSFAATIKGFGTGDTIDATNFHAPPATTLNFVENSAMTGGTLTLTDTSQSLTANILMTGVYSNSSFTLAPDTGTGTLVKFV
jgi:hypothetical protein